MKLSYLTISTLLLTTIIYDYFISHAFTFIQSIYIVGLFISLLNIIHFFKEKINFHLLLIINYFTIISSLVMLYFLYIILFGYTFTGKDISKVWIITSLLSVSTLITASIELYLIKFKSSINSD